MQVNQAGQASFGTAPAVGADGKKQQQQKATGTINSGHQKQQQTTDDYFKETVAAGIIIMAAALGKWHNSIAAEKGATGIIASIRNGIAGVGETIANGAKSVKNFLFGGKQEEITTEQLETNIDAVKTYGQDYLYSGYKKAKEAIKDLKPEKIKSFEDAEAKLAEKKKAYDVFLEEEYAIQQEIKKAEKDVKDAGENPAESLTKAVTDAKKKLEDLAKNEERTKNKAKAKEEYDKARTEIEGLYKDSDYMNWSAANALEKGYTDAATDKKVEGLWTHFKEKANSEHIDYLKSKKDAAAKELGLISE